MLANSSRTASLLVSKAWNRSSIVLLNSGICDDYPVERFDPSAPEKIHYPGTDLGFPGVQQVVLAAGLDEHPVALPYVYKAYDQRVRWRRLSGSRQDLAAASAGEEQ